MTKIHEKDFNKEDGNSVYQEVLADRNERNRKSYKQAIKNAFVRNEDAKNSLSISSKEADRNQKKLDDLVSGGMESFLATDDDEEKEEDDGSYGRASRPTSKFPRPYRKF